MKFSPISSVLRKSPCCPVRLFGLTLLLPVECISDSVCCFPDLDSCDEDIDIGCELAISSVSPKTSVKLALKRYKNVHESNRK